MFPGVYGFTWDAGNLVFLGLFFSIAAVIGSTVILASMRAWRDYRDHKDQRIRWHEDFSDLPARLKACRHELSGEIAHRTCPHAFDCRECNVHPVFVERRASAPLTPAAVEPVSGFEMPADRLYHRGHTWVQQQDNGELLVGLDDFGKRVFGTPETVDLPLPGTRLEVNGTGWNMSRHGHHVRVLSPVEGEVIGIGSPDDAWTLKVRPAEGKNATTHLLSGSEARTWIVRELENLQIKLGAGSVGPSLADGGELVNDLPAQSPGADWDAVWGEVFMEP